MRTLKSNITFIISGVAIVLSGCGGDTLKANEANFKTALNAHYSKMKECSGIGEQPDDKGFISTFNAKGKDWNANKRDRFVKLEKLGVLELVKFQKEEKSFTTGTELVDHVGYRFSKMGSTYLRPSELDAGTINSGIPQLCYGTRQVVDILNFTGPAEANGVRASNVRYTYKLVDIAPWADSPSVKAKDNNATEDSDDLVLTDKGWVHHSIVR